MKNYILLLTMGIVFNIQTKSQTIRLEESHWFRKGPFSGYVKSLAMAPSNPNVIYLGTYASGIYKTTDGGETWASCSTENLPVFEDTLGNSPSLPCWWFGDFYPIETIAVHPQDENHLWISTLERGLYESTDGGESWQKANETLADTLAVNLIKINLQDPNDIFLGTGKYFTPNSHQNSGLYRTLDGGNTWNLIENLPNGNTYYINDIERDPTDNNHIIVSIGSSGESGFSLGIMESFDNGNSWQELSANMYDFKNIANNPENPQNLWGVALTGYQDYWLLNSNDGGQNWNLYEGFEDPYKWVTGLYSDTDFNIYIKRQTDEPDFSFGILRSSDNGNSWSGVDKLTNKTYFGWDNFKNACCAETSNTDNVYFGNNYGVFHSENGGITTQVKNNKLMNSYILDLEVNPKNNDIIYAAGYFQGLWKSMDAGQHWENVIRENIKVVKCDPKYPDTFYFGGRDLWRSFDGGETFQKIAAPLYSTLVDIAINPKETNVLYYKIDVWGPVPTSYIYKSIDYGNTWVLIFSCLISYSYREIAIDPIHPDTLYVGQYRTLNGGETWEKEFNKKILAVHPQNSNVLYATDGVFQDDQTTIEVSYDWGNTFEVLAEYHNGPFPNYNIYCLRIDNKNPDYMFYSTRNTDIFYSLDAGENWQQLQGKYNKRVTDIIPFVNDNKFYLATHGDGVWVYDTTNTSAIDDMIGTNEIENLKVLPNPFIESTNIRFQIENVSMINISIYNIQGELINTLVNERKTKGEYKIIWNGTDKNGKEVNNGLYFVRLNSGRNIYTRKVVLLK